MFKAVKIDISALGTYHLKIVPMQKHLYFVCPTDYLEPVIDNQFGHNNYFYTSLGNSVKFDFYTVAEIGYLIEKHNINEISFVLSDANPIITDALKNQDFDEIRGLDNFYDEMVMQKQCAYVLWQNQNCTFTILSYYLNKRIKQLELELSDLNIPQIKISGKIYSKAQNAFNEIYSELICREYFGLN